jgi:subtilisin family serine protease
MMTGRKKHVIFSLVVLCCFALSITLFSGGNRPRVLPLDKKMSPFLKQLSEIYRTHNVLKLRSLKNDGNLPTGMVATNNEIMESEILLQKLFDQGGTRTLGNISSVSDGKDIDQLFDPVLQQRWGNPPFDVAKGAITTSADPRTLESSFLKIRQVWQNNGKWMAFCEFDISKAKEIAELGSVTYLDLLPLLKAENDLGSASTGAPRLRIGSPANYNGNVGYTGQGVIVGDVDSGVDWAHGDFLNADGTSRILYLWDTSVTDTLKTPEALFGMTGFNYGTVYTKADIDNGLCTEFDPSSNGGHGTHTLGTAAGNGGATGNYTGMAPNADIIFVKGLDLSGVEFIFEMAKRLGRPTSVNNSYGMGNPFQYGAYLGQWYNYPGDGSDIYSQYWDWVASQYPTGAVIGKSAGNNGMWQTYTDHSGSYGFAMYNGSLHFGGTSTQGSATAHTFHYINNDRGYGQYREYNDFMVRSDVPIRITVRTDATHTYVFQTGGSGAIDAAHSTVSSYNLTTTDANNGEYGGVMWFDSRRGSGNVGFPIADWTFTVEPLIAGNTANYDIWAYSYVRWYATAARTSVYSFYDSCFTTNSSHSEYQLDFTACRAAIVAGAWTTRSEWLGADGNWHYPWGFLEPWINTVTYFSSPGPARDGRMKPDIGAPGAAIMSTLASNLSAGLANSEKDPDLRHQWMWGTSMAAPHLTGAMALMLQKYPNSDLERVRGMVTGWAYNDGNTQAIGPNGFGAGKLNVMPLNNAPVAVITVDKSELILDNNEIATFDGSTSYDRENFPLTFAWRLVSTPAGAAAAALTPAGTKASLKPDPNLEGTYQVGLVVNDTIVDSAMAVVSVVAKFYPVLPPANAQLQRLENDFIFYKEYVNKLTWQANPGNKATIANYKLYKKVKGSADSSYALVSALPPTTFSYEDKGLKKDQLFTYKLTSINSRGKESDPIVVGN